MVMQQILPWTQGGREFRIQQEVAKIYARYFQTGPRWNAKHLSQRGEMEKWASLLSVETVEMLVGNYGIESFVEDYAEMTVLAAGDSVATKGIYTQWVFDETRHSLALWYSLVDSGLRTHAELDEYRYQCGQDTWTFERQTGHEATPERGAAYAIAQERQTKRNYQDLAKRIWVEYGEPRDGDGRPVYPAIAGVCQILARDEGFHEGVFRDITRVYLTFWPEKALQAMWDVFERYRMPIVKLPNAEAFLHAVLSTGIDSRRNVPVNVLLPTYNGLWLETRSAVRRAAENSLDLPEGAVLQIGDETPDYWSEGAVPYRMSPNGSLERVVEVTSEG